MHVLLLNPPDDLDDMLGVGKDFVQKYEPLGLLYLAAVVREAGARVTVVDAHAEGLDREAVQRRIADARADIVGFSTLTCSGAAVYYLGRWLREVFPETMVVLGNVHAAVYARPYLKCGCCDVVVHGEGEEPLRALLEVRRGRRTLAEVPAISYLDAAGEVVRTEPDAVFTDLAALPMPARDLVDQRLYELKDISNQVFIAEDGGRAKTLITSRGCPFRCAFCVVHGSHGPRYNVPERVVDELEMLEKEHGAAYVYIMDPLFMGHRARLVAICDEIRRRGLTIRWGCDTSVNVIDPEIVRTIAAAGCYDLSLGIESGVQRLLDRVNKKIRLPKVVEAVHTIKAHSDIQLEGLFILGLPGETEADSLETIRFAKRLPLDMAQFSILCPYPGSPLFEELAAAGEIDTGIREGDRLDPEVWKHYSSYILFTDNEPIWLPEGMTYPQLRRLQKRANREFYLRPRQVLKQLKRVRPSNVLRIAKVAFKGFF